LSGLEPHQQVEAWSPPIPPSLTPARCRSATSQRAWRAAWPWDFLETSHSSPSGSKQLSSEMLVSCTYVARDDRPPRNSREAVRRACRVRV